MGVSVFTDSLIEVLGLSRVKLSLAYLIGTALSALLLSPAGKLYDRFGARPAGTVVILFLSLQLLVLSRLKTLLPRLQSLFQGDGIVLPFVLITMSFFILRFFGQGMLTLISRNMVMKWFEARRGLANAIMGTFVSFGFAYAPRFFNGLIAGYQWNGAYLRLGLFIGTAGLVTFWLFARDDPRKCGLSPDGAVRQRGKETAVPKYTGPDRDYTLKEARGTLPFWVFSLSSGLTALISTAMTFHIVSIFNIAGMSRGEAVAIFLPASFISVSLNFAASWLSDHISLRYILQVYIIGQVLTLFALMRLAPGPSLILLVIGYGILMGLFNALSTLVWPRYFGITHLGAISGMAMAFMVIGSAVGPYVFSLSLDLTGLYNAACLGCLVLSAVLLGLSFRVRRPSRAGPSL